MSKTEKELCDMLAEASTLRWAHEQQSGQIDDVINNLEEFESICEGVSVYVQRINARLNDLEDWSKRKDLHFQGIEESNQGNWE